MYSFAQDFLYNDKMKRFSYETDEIWKEEIEDFYLDSSSAVAFYNGTGDMQKVNVQDVPPEFSEVFKKDLEKNYKQLLVEGCRIINTFSLNVHC